MPAPAGQSCATCVYFYVDQFVEMTKRMQAPSYGGCHRYPPQVEFTTEGMTQAEQYRSRWPSVLPGDWCAEWKGAT